MMRLLAGLLLALMLAAIPVSAEFVTTVPAGTGSGSTITVPLPVNQGGTGTTTVFTPGSIIFAGTSGVYSQDNANLFWDDTNNRVGIGTALPGAPLVIQANTTSAAVVPTGTMLHLNAADAVQAAVTFDSYAQNGVFKFRRANTGAAAPSALANNDPIGGLQFFGYGATAYSPNNRGAYLQRAAGDWTSTAQGTKAVISTTLSGTTTTISTLTAEDYGTVTANDYFKSNAGFTRVTTQFDKTSDASLANITGLSSSVRAGKTYTFEAILYTTSNVAGGVQFAIAGTATATAIIYEAIVEDGAAVSAHTRATTLSTAVGGITAVTAAYARITGTITVNAAGTLTVQFAQNTSNINTSSVLVGSTFMLWEVN